MTRSLPAPRLAAGPNAYVWSEDDRTAPRQEAADLAGQCRAAAALAIELGSVLGVAQTIANRVGINEPENAE